MKTRIGTLFIMATYLSASPCSIAPGQINCGKGEMSELSAHGIANMNSTSFTDDVTIYGKLTANNCDFKKLEIHGDATIDNSTLTDAYMYGFLSLKSCEVKSPLNIFSNKASIIDSSTHNIIVNHSDNPVITLKNTSVHGDIIFAGGFGTVKCLGNCNIEGKIEHGSIKK